MALLRTEPRDQLGTRICVGCGYGGRELQGDISEIGYECPLCGEDLYARPPMSYREMEGFTSVSGGGTAGGAGAGLRRAGRIPGPVVRRLIIAESVLAVVVVATAIVVVLA